MKIERKQARSQQLFSPSMITGFGALCFTNIYMLYTQVDLIELDSDTKHLHIAADHRRMAEHSIAKFSA